MIRSLGLSGAASTALIAVTLSLAACATASQRSEALTLIDPARGDELLQQCSRQAPGKQGGYFRPSPQQVTAIESGAMRALRDARSEGEYAAFAADRAESPNPFAWPDDPSLYTRQYVGYIAAGRRMIYGNYLPAGSWSGEGAPAIVCDGGPAFFGVEYDLDARRVVRIAFNGGLGGPFLPPIEPPAQ